LDPQLKQSAVLTVEEHQAFTNARRAQIPYRIDYAQIPLDDLWIAAQQVYANNPELLESARQTLLGK